ncbi:hypothetical protein FLAG1_06801 [Fusarium langsethiae]|uniref:BTB domain-containing protein n=1 Tax=Fusarium langsethiae TaxID=179993 RepID=A0A0N0DDX7_FUSLA|nr:hypothetical protein FLAG1_06801 [Fusarium langsethiae]GKU04187.1 unnamed protein product [Fusarium langsethiae]GKU16406.1 unnamed protein product [Fusarium langsethiae]
MSASLSDSSQSSTAQITKICENGDVILAVGPKVKIQVASDFLKHISPVFKAMFDSPMSEGEALRNKSPDSPITISLPEDRGEAMTRLLRILYGADDVELGFKAFYNVIILADKYGMTERLKHFGSSWVRMDTDDNNSDLMYSQDCWEKLVISYILNDNSAFFKISFRLYTLARCVINQALELPDKMLGLKLALAIYELRDDNEC